MVSPRLCRIKPRTTSLGLWVNALTSGHFAFDMNGKFDECMAKTIAARTITGLVGHLGDGLGH